MKSTPSFASRGIVVLGTTLCVLAPMPACAQDAKPLLFFSNRGENKLKFSIYSMKPDGSDQKNLTKSDMTEFDPAFSLDGQTIVFVAQKIATKVDDKPEGAIYTMKADGSERKKLTDFTGLAYSPLFSPDGKNIAFTTISMEITEPAIHISLQVMDADGKNKKQVAEGMISGWSPDGKQLLMAGGSEGNGLYIMDADGKNLKKLAGQNAMFGTFSPDGKKIVCMAEVEPSQYEVVVMNADGSDKKSLTKTDAMEFAPKWAADGKSLYFTRFPKELGNPLTVTVTIFRMDIDGKNEKALTSPKGINAMAGSAIVFGYAIQQAITAVEEKETKPEAIKK